MNKKLLSKQEMDVKQQFKLYLSEDLIERLDSAAEKFGRKSKQAVAEEIISLYLPVWTATNKAMSRAIEAQTKAQKKHVGEKTETANKQKTPSIKGAEIVEIDGQKYIRDNDGNYVLLVKGGNGSTDEE